jgi:hypothetical protein
MLKQVKDVSKGNVYIESTNTDPEVFLRNLSVTQNIKEVKNILKSLKS